MGQNTPKSEPVNITFIQVFQEVKDKLAYYPLDKSESLRKQASQHFELCMKSDSYCRIIGCLFGCLIGDALGAYCQFSTAPLSEECLSQTMEMKGGGVFNLYRGQFTDDSQMAFHLLRGLSTLTQSEKLEDQSYNILLQIAKQYVEWSKSMPFDMGITCRKGISVLANTNGNTPQKKVQTLLEKVKVVNGGSQSNGSLMRIAPMAIFFAIIDEDPKKHETFIKDEIGLIHCNEVLKQAGNIWVKVLFDLITRKDNQISTFKAIWKTAESNSANEQIRSWFDQAREKIPLPACENMGWAKIAWTYGMNILYRLSIGMGKQLNYYEEIKKVISRGGDSDTNAAIVGGLLGAYLGFKQLPANYLHAIFDLQFKEKREKLIDRPKDYEPINVLAEMLKLIRIGQGYKRTKTNQSIPQTHL